MSEQNPYTTPSAEGSNISPTQTNPSNWKEMHFSFKGRIGRKQFWMGFLAQFGIAIVAIIIVGLLTTISEYLAILAIIVYIPLIWGGLALQAKRWHDRDKSAAWILIGLIPIIGGIWSFVETGFLVGTNGSNKYGEDPLV